MNVLMIAINDPAGTAIAFTKALRAYTPHRCRLVTLEIRYNFMFEKDIHVPWLDERGLEELRRELETADVLHFHMTADEDIRLGPYLVRDFMDGKTIVHHHHGHPDFRGYPEKYRRKYAERGRANLLVSTPDLLRLLPEARWQPNLVPVNEELYTPLPDKTEPPVVVAHSPTRKDLKNTDEFLVAMADLQERGAPAELDLIENTAHVECLERKRRSHLIFDHLQGYFGVSSLEGLSQGVCTIAGVDAWNARHVREYSGVERLPWFISSTEGLRGDLALLVNDRAAREEQGAYARRFMVEHYSDRKAALYLADFYESVI